MKNKAFKLKWIFVLTFFLMFILPNKAHAQTEVPLTDIVKITLGGNHTCALNSDGAVYCWGKNLVSDNAPWWENASLLGNGGTIDSDVAIHVSRIGSGATDVVATSEYTCASMSDEGVMCWGRSTRGGLGTGETVNSKPNNVRLVSSVFEKEVTSYDLWGQMTCAVSNNGSLSCWGGNRDSQDRYFLGNGTTNSSTTPVAVFNANSAKQVVIRGTSCYLSLSDEVFCWGRNNGNNSQGLLGDGTYEDKTIPVKVVGLSNVSKIFPTHTTLMCALTYDHNLWCWGKIELLGNGGVENNNRPVLIASDVLDFSSSSTHTCIVTGSYDLKCWGSNAHGQLGYPSDNTLQTVPTSVSTIGNRVAKVTVSINRTCIIDFENNVYCWGQNYYGESGQNTEETSSHIPQHIKNVSEVKEVVSNDSYSCAITMQQTVLCWGRNYYGQLGNGTTEDSATAEVVKTVLVPSISGRVINQNGIPISGAVIRTERESTVTNSDGTYTLYQRAELTRIYASKEGFSFEYNGRWISIPTNNNVNFIARGDSPSISLPQPAENPSEQSTGYTSSKQPLLLVHGWQAVGGYTCSAEFGPYYLPNLQEWGSSIPLGDMPQWYQDAGYDVWIAYIDSANGNAASFVQNANCLEKQVSRLAGFYPAKKIDLVAHSMGGVVSRACISYYECGSHIKTLTTLGSPHAGVQPEVLIRFGGFVRNGLSQFLPQNMTYFNAWNPNNPDIRYIFIAGTGAESIAAQAVFSMIGQDNDGFVATQSAFGLSNNGTASPTFWIKNAVGYETDETHTSSLGGNSYYSQRGGQQSSAFFCSLRELQGETQGCEPFVSASAYQGNGTVAFTPIITGTIEAGAVITRQIQLDGKSTIFLYSTSSDVTGTVISPSGLQTVIVDNVASPDLSEPGVWSVRIDASTAAEVTAYRIFAMVESSSTVEITHQQLAYNLFKVVVTTTNIAELDEIEGTITFGGTTEKLFLAKTAVNTYETAWEPPTNAVGSVSMQVQVAGRNGEVSFQREAYDFWEIIPENLISTLQVSTHSPVTSTNAFVNNVSITGSVQSSKNFSGMISLRVLNGEELISTETNDVNFVIGTNNFVFQLKGDFPVETDLKVDLAVLDNQSVQPIAEQVSIYTLVIKKESQVIQPKLDMIYLPIVTR